MLRENHEAQPSPQVVPVVQNRHWFKAHGLWPSKTLFRQRQHELPISFLLRLYKTPSKQGLTCMTIILAIKTSTSVTQNPKTHYHAHRFVECLLSFHEHRTTKSPRTCREGYILLFAKNEVGTIRRGLVLLRTRLYCTQVRWSGRDGKFFFVSVISP